MLSLVLGDAGALRSVLVLGAHADDIEIGCGGTLFRLLEAHPQLDVEWVVLSAPGVRRAEAGRSADAWLDGVNQRSIVVHDFADGAFPYQGLAIRQVFEELKSRMQPDLILTHYRDDRHQDHRLVSELTWNTFRDQLILEYEVPKYDGDFGSPNVFVHLSREKCARKVRGLLEHFPSQRERRWFTDDVFTSVLRLRGMESNSSSGFAEGFYCRKLVAVP